MTRAAPTLRLDLPALDSAASNVVVIDVILRDANDSPEPVASALTLFRSAFDAGMFSSQGNAAQGMDTLVLDDALPLCQRWQMHCVERGAFRVLVNLLAVVSRNQTSLQSLHIHSAGGAAQELESVSPKALSYPRRAEHLPFALKLKSRLAGTKNPCVRVDFATAIDDEQLGQLSGMFAVWGRVVLHGGYDTSTENLMLDDQLNLGETYPVAPRTLEHSFNATVTAVAAFDGVINMLARLNRPKLPIVMVEVE